MEINDALIVMDNTTLGIALVAGLRRTLPTDHSIPPLPFLRVAMRTASVPAQILSIVMYRYFSSSDFPTPLKNKKKETSTLLHISKHYRPK